MRCSLCFVVHLLTFTCEKRISVPKKRIEVVVPKRGWIVKPEIESFAKRAFSSHRWLSYAVVSTSDCHHESVESAATWRSTRRWKPIDPGDSLKLPCRPYLVDLLGVACTVPFPRPPVCRCGSFGCSSSKRSSALPRRAVLTPSRTTLLTECMNANESATMHTMVCSLVTYTNWIMASFVMDVDLSFVRSLFQTQSLVTFDEDTFIRSAVAVATDAMLNARSRELILANNHR